MLEMVIFELLAVSLFLIIFFKIIRRNDANYLILLIFQLIGIVISFLRIEFGICNSLGSMLLRYIFSILIPFFVFIMELRGINFSIFISLFEAKFLMVIGDTKAAKNVLVKLVSKYPNTYLGHKLLAECYEKEGGMRRAIEEYVTSVDLKGNDYKSFFKIAELLRDLGRNDEAIEMLNRLLKSKPDCYEASMLLGEILCDEDRLKEAENVYWEALKYRPNDFDLYFNLGIVYTRLSDFQMAKEMYQRAATLNHLNVMLNYNLGLIAFMQEDYENAETYFENSIYDEMEASSYYQLAKIYVYREEKDKAINFLNKAIELDSKYLKLATKDMTFKNIKQYITVSVNMNEDIDKEIDEDKSENNNVKSKSTFKFQVEKAKDYLEETAQMIEEMRENADEAKIAEKLDNIFKKEKERKEVKEKKISIENEFIDKINDYKDQKQRNN